MLLQYLGYEACLESGPALPPADLRFRILRQGSECGSRRGGVERSSFPQLGRKMPRRDRVTVVGDRDRPLDFVLQLPNVTWPSEANDHLQRLASDPVNALAAVLGSHRDDSVCEQRNVLGSLAEWR